MTSDVQTRVIQKIAEHLDVDPSKVKPEARLADDLGADSLDQVEIVMACEEEFGIEIPDNAAEKIITVADAISFIEEQVKKVA